ncbi:efflux RND transporter permease subunit [Rhodobacter sphaeroides]|jgi:HAE1 family hydrophobic/amphiphilic exporter-1/multidrug efflux pump|uniref:Efflux pump membrane transporter n=1 Tax=Cereibacter sphaeroides (strain ATCC 17023 / DSM 158 / JCM 6121 / CCUG 31486 / LMG 2827 / NBRC 12203 / NCIMB 8253 / ATH 2.4.1.) TaxID=272943 RepID=Q3IX11_CERS4|nr:efflux RND transporter permease subunit [Cereibacter sphaeroides]ABA80923.1 Cation/multidrug efflux pump, RND family [Cereibacter sphaeroides 2.4.1]AXC63219.1 multidrug efflux RND transporter permease subunit [Cereibacter sphaeroides 2.4.1]MVX49692.1 efflux RND transporter permease subunit [Cereibacter sphaeroides]QJC86157.1 efflux RND transporter permease subunit [Cereibacter sphaeroides]GEM94450.1 multidrug efflux RND transporter permease subunit [Cereibacter sphaeroides]
MGRFFIDRPVFAWVIAIVIMALGVLSILRLPVSQYPSIAPPAVVIGATYPGASAETVTDTVTQVIEREMTGLDGLRYISSSSTSTGVAQITLTFELGTDPDIAQVQVQNKLSQAQALLPQAVVRQGVTVRKSSAGFLMVIAMTSDNGAYSASELADYMSSNMVESISRLPGVGSVQVFGSQHAMRIWLDPNKLNAYDLSPSDVTAAVSAQNAQISAGSFGARPAPEGQQLQATITAQSLLQTPEDFEQIVLRAETDGGLALLRDVARVELGAQSYEIDGRYNRSPASGMAIQLASGANALDTADVVRAKVDELAAFFPEGMTYEVPYDTTPFVRISIEEVVKTLIEAIVLVVLVMLLFLQNIRATLIPTLAVPVVLLGTFGVMAALGFSINTLTMLAMVLAIGLLVDDAIVVVENVERIMEQEGLDPVAATRKSMDEISGALVAIAMVLSAVFVPMAFFGGSTGEIYKQFSITIVSAMALSVLVALTLTPALCATILKRGHHSARRGPVGWFNRGFDATTRGYGGLVGRVVRRPVLMMVLFGVIVAGMVTLFQRTPTAFLPDEDQGVLITLIQTPSGATAERTLAAIKEVENYWLEKEGENVTAVFGVNGFSFAGQGQNMGIVFVRLKPWEERLRPDQSVAAMAGRAFPTFMGMRDAMVFPIVPPPVLELGNSNGFTLFLQARQGQSHEELLDARNMLLGLASQSPLLASVRPNGVEDASQFRLDIDWRKAGAVGVTAAQVGDFLNTAWAGSYVNDFLDQGRVKRVYVQGEPWARTDPDDLDLWRIPNKDGEFVALSTFADQTWFYGPQQVARYNAVRSMEIQGQPVPGISSGEAMAEMERLAAQLPPGFALEWTGLSLEEREAGDQASLLFLLSVGAVFLCLAALYESWSVPIAVLLAMPVGILGALLGAWAGHQANGVYFQVGLLTVVGLTGKNGIMIVEFARSRLAQGEPLLEAIRHAAVLRFRPILMTSLAFSLGVVPLVLSTGAGAGARRAIGDGILGGTITGTLLGIVFVPVFFVLVNSLFRRRKTAPAAATA